MNAPIHPASLVAETGLLDTLDGDLAFTLRRTGQRPLRFTGHQVIEARSNPQAHQVWHDLNIYRTAKGRYVFELIARHAEPEQQDVFRVESFDTLEAGAAWLQDFPAGDDAPIPDGLGAEGTPLPRAVLQAVQLRQHMERIDAEYRSLLSEVFMALELCEPGDEPA